MSKQMSGQSSKRGKSASNKPTGPATNKQTKIETNKQTKPEPNKSGKLETTKQAKLEPNKQGKVETNASKQTAYQTPKQVRQEKKREEQRRREEEQRRAARNRRIALISTIAVLVAIAASVFFYVRASSQPGQPANSPQIRCDQGEQLAYHIHAHLTIYINGQVAQLPANVGIASDGSCLYWLHTHDSSGVIHIESPAQYTFKLSDFLNLWGNQFVNLNYPAQLDTSYGWTAWVDGKPYKGDFHNIPLKAHELITLAYNSPGVKPDTTYNWSGL